VEAVSSAETERSYIPVDDPADRPRTTRETVRVIMIDHDRTLLFEDSDPGVPDARWWVTPGGQIEPDESMTQAAIREVAEETGCSLSEADLRGPIAYRHVVHGYSDQVIEQDEAFFLAMVQPFEVDISAHTPDEQKTILQHRWWSHDDLRHTDEWIWPVELVELWSLVGEPERWPVDLGTQEESTVLDTH
jgi:8-oxo-dGTP pyrophosphatase MutT (NUDIX family)